MLHLTGYDVSMDDLKAFRQLDSKTPGHPEFGWTPGVESTTGPLGQGVGNGVGMAAAAKLAAATLNTAEHTIIDHHVVVLCGDGCLQEGIANEAAAFAGHEKLDNLILMYDSNGVTLDKMAEHTQSEDVQMRFEAQGWEVLTVDGHDMDALTKAYRYAKESKNGKPTLIVCKTIIGKGVDEIAGTCAAHGEAGVKYVESAKESLGLTEPWEVSSETYDFFAKQVVCLSWDSCSPMGGDGASWVVSFAGVYWFCSSDWENEGPCSSLGEALGCSSSFSMATHNATLKSDTMSAEELLPIAEDVCPHDGTIYVNGSDYRHGDDGLVLADDDDDD